MSQLGNGVLIKKYKGSNMYACRKCNNTNVAWNGGWKQCANCGEVHERDSTIISEHTVSLQERKSLKDIASLPLRSTRIGKLISRFHLIS